jgi:chromosome partitioning protein
MHLIAFLSQKGGSGKTTLAVHAAVAAHEAGERVILIDTDPQGSAQAWAKVRKAPAPTIERSTPSTLTHTIQAAQKNGATLIVIDSPPHFRPGVDILASAADFLLIPCRPSAFDLAAIVNSAQIAKAAKKPSAFILNACEARAPEVDKAKEFLRPHSFPIAPVNIGNRRAFSRAIITGSAVTEFEPKGKAAQEITELWQWIAKQIGKQHGKK